MERELADFVHEAEPRFVITLGSGMSQIEQNHIAPIAMLIYAAYLKFIARPRGESAAQCAPDHFCQCRVLTEETKVDCLIHWPSRSPIARLRE
jgi:hypothetical protein